MLDRIDTKARARTIPTTSSRTKIGAAPRDASIAALNRYDGREANSLDTWYADDAKRPDSSPGHVIHYQLDTSETLGGDWGRTGSLGEFSKRLGWSYALDWGDIGRDFVTLGIPMRPWDRVHDTTGHEIFGHYSLRDFVADEWKNEYPNPAFSRMTERDGAWMARILAHFTPENVRALAEIGDFTKRDNTDFLASVLEGRLEKILERYLLKLSPLGDAHVDEKTVAVRSISPSEGACATHEVSLFGADRKRGWRSR